jgi:hypothetical protein
MDQGLVPLVFLNNLIGRTPLPTEFDPVWWFHSCLEFPEAPARPDRGTFAADPPLVRYSAFCQVR